MDREKAEGIGHVIMRSKSRHPLDWSSDVEASYSGTSPTYRASPRPDPPKNTRCACAERKQHDDERFFSFLWLLG